MSNTALHLDLRTLPATAHQAEAEIDRGVLDRFCDLTGTVPGSGHGAGVPLSFLPVMTTHVLRRALRDMLPDEVLSCAVLARQTLRAHRPIPLGRTLQHEATCAGLRSTARGVRIGFQVKTSAGDELVAQQLVELSVPNTTTTMDLGERLSEAQVSPGVVNRRETVVKVPADLSLRFAEATGEDLEVHVSDDAARAGGFPGVILQGTCTLAMTHAGLTEACASEGRSVVESLAVSFAGPVIPPAELVLAFEMLSADAGGLATVRFEATAAGLPVLRNGIAAVVGAL